MNSQGGSPTSQTKGMAGSKNAGRLPLAAWIEQDQEFHGAYSAGSETALDWADAFLPYPSPAALRADIKALERQLIQLAERIQSLEQR